MLRLFSVCKDVRQLLILQILIELGLRSRELLRLELKGFDKKRRTVVVHNTKGDKMRVVPYGAYIRTTLQQYIRMLGYYPKATIIESYKYKGQPLSLSGPQKIIREIAKRSGIKKNIHGHLFIENTIYF